jgi:CRISPR system Cascade subunit CasD
MRILLLRFEAPLMSFGAVCVDSRGPTWDHPSLSQVTGLIANALGYDHADGARLQRLQERLRLASRVDRQGSRQPDYQTVDLDPETSPWMKEGWTTRGALEGRGGGKDAREGTHIRLRDYHADRIHTLAVTLEPADEAPGIDECVAALRQPARPLFLGRKPCLPSRPVLLATDEAPSLRESLARWPRHHRADAGPLAACWGDDGSPKAADERTLPIVDERDWHAQLHAGRRLLRLGRVNPPEAAHV